MKDTVWQGYRSVTPPDWMLPGSTGRFTILCALENRKELKPFQHVAVCSSVLCICSVGPYPDSPDISTARPCVRLPDMPSHSLGTKPNLIAIPPCLDVDRIHLAVVI